MKKLCRLTPALMLVVTAVSNGFSNGFILDTRPSPWTASVIMERFITEGVGLILVFR